MSVDLLCKIREGSTEYLIQIGDGLVFSQTDYLRSLGSRFVIITDDRVEALYGTKLLEFLRHNHLSVDLLSFPSGEEYKTRQTKELLEDLLFQKGFARDTCVLALGGGVVTDMAGYIAATYCRGVPLVMIPTTLLAMVDASIGGKTGVNVSFGKNLVGAIYQPKKVVIDRSFLKSLPLKEKVNGIIEMIKHALISDGAFFTYLEKNSLALLALDPEAMERAIFTSCLIKKQIVEQDEKENGKRRLLNFGHTIGHAIEKISSYKISHGEAVAIGLLVESYISLELGVLSLASFLRIKAILQAYGVPLSLPFFSAEKMIEVMSLDKKSKKGEIRFVILAEIGFCLPCDFEFCAPIPESLLVKAFDWMSYDLCCC